MCINPRILQTLTPILINSILHTLLYSGLEPQLHDYLFQDAGRDEIKENLARLVLCSV